MTILYGSNTPNGTLATASSMAQATGGVEASVQTPLGGVGQPFGECTSQGVAVNDAAAISATGNGWIFFPGAGTFAAGNWSALINAQTLGDFNLIPQAILDIRQWSSGIYTAIGQIVVANPFAANNVKTLLTFAAAAMPQVTLGASDGVYFGLWIKDTTGAAGDNPTVFVSNNVVNGGVANDMQITTPTFTPTTAATQQLIRSDRGMEPAYLPGGIN